jgi:hypothetical protein
MKRHIVLSIAAIVIAVALVDLAIVYIVGTRNCCRDWSQALDKSKAALDRTQAPLQRFHVLPEAAKSAAEVRQYPLAEAYASELLRLAPQFPRDWNYGNAIHDGHMVLGRVALARGQRNTARRELLLAGATPGSPQLDSFGPNMSLAKDMLAAGEQDAVFRYFDECRSFWQFGSFALH